MLLLKQAATAVRIATQLGPRKQRGDTFVPSTC